MSEKVTEDALSRSDWKKVVANLREGTSVRNERRAIMAAERRYAKKIARLKFRESRRAVGDE